MRISACWKCRTNLLYQELCTLVLYVSLRCGEKCTDRVDSDAALDTHDEEGGGQPGDVTDLNEARACTLELIQPVVVSSIHHTWKRVTMVPHKVDRSLPSSVLGCRVTHPVCMYSISCRNTSGSNSSIIIVWCCCEKAWAKTWIADWRRSFLYLINLRMTTELWMKPHLL